MSESKARPACSGSTRRPLGPITTTSALEDAELIDMPVAQLSCPEPARLEQTAQRGRDGISSRACLATNGPG